MVFTFYIKRIFYSFRFASQTAIQHNFEQQLKNLTEKTWKKISQPIPVTKKKQVFSLQFAVKVCVISVRKKNLRKPTTTQRSAIDFQITKAGKKIDNFWLSPSKYTSVRGFYFNCGVENGNFLRFFLQLNKFWMKKKILKESKKVIINFIDKKI